MDIFQPLQGGVLLRLNGAYSEAKLFTLDDVVYAKSGSTYIKLMGAGRTSKPKTSWSKLSINHHLTYPMDVMTLGKIMIPSLQVV